MKMIRFFDVNERIVADAQLAHGQWLLSTGHEGSLTSCLDEADVFAHVFLRYGLEDIVNIQVTDGNGHGASYTVLGLLGKAMSRGMAARPVG